MGSVLEGPSPCSTCHCCQRASVFADAELLWSLYSGGTLECWTRGGAKSRSQFSQGFELLPVGRTETDDGKMK